MTAQRITTRSGLHGAICDSFQRFEFSLAPIPTEASMQCAVELAGGPDAMIGRFASQQQKAGAYFSVAECPNIGGAASHRRRLGAHQSLDARYKV